MKAPTRRNLRGFYFAGALKNEIARKLPLELVLNGRRKVSAAE